MLKDLSPDQQIKVVNKIFAQFEFAYEALKFKCWREENAALSWAQFLGEATSDDIKKAVKNCLEHQFIFDPPSVTEFYLLCEITPVKPVEIIPEPIAIAEPEIMPPRAARHAGAEPVGQLWAVKLWRREQDGELLPVDSIRMYRAALGLD